MGINEKQALLVELEHSQQVLLDALRGVSESVARRNPAPDRWSVLQCVEHLAVSEDYLFERIVAAHGSDTPMVDEQREARIVSRGLDRTIKVPSPEVGKPTGRFSTLAEAIRCFRASRERTLEFVQNSDEDLRAKLTSHPMIGVVNCYETLLMMAVHPRRHAMQLEEIKAAFASEEITTQEPSG
jgi:DinB superfamily